MCVKERKRYRETGKQTDTEKKRRKKERAEKQKQRERETDRSGFGIEEHSPCTEKSLLVID